MKVKNVKKLVIINIILLIPFLLYGIFKNGYLIYLKDLISFKEVFKPLYLVLISIVVKFIIDIIIYHKLEIDYNLLSLILVALIMPYNINYLIYIITLTITYLLSIFMLKKFKFNQVCFIYLIIVLINSLFNNFTYFSPLEDKYNFSFSFLDLLFGRSVGGISSTSILFSLIIYSILTYSIYYKRDIPLFINITYLLLMFIYYLFSHDNSMLLNNDLIFASIFISTLPLYSPSVIIYERLYGILIGIIAFITSITFNSIISIYIAIFLVSLLLNINIQKIRQNKPLAK